MYPCPHRLDADRCPMCLHAHIEDLQGTITELRVKIIDQSNREDRILFLESENARLCLEGTPGVVHAVDKAFHELTLKERNIAWEKVNLLEKELAVAGCERSSLLQRLHDLEYYKPVKGAV